MAVAATRAGRVRTDSLGVRSRRLLGYLIRAGGDGRFGPLITPQSDERRRPVSDGLQSGAREFADGERFLHFFDDRLSIGSLRGRTVLDLGCGYGGRTAYYALYGEPELVVGLEVEPDKVDRCRAFAAQKHAARAQFTVGRAENLPYEDGGFDLVLSYDVLEHVADPAQAFREIRRVTRPGGQAWLAFPSYLGARSSHLDYVTRLPALHRIFDPDTVIEVVNELLSSDPARYRVALQPPPSVGPFGRKTLPLLNGMTYRESRRLIRQAGLEVIFEKITPALYPDSQFGAVRLIGRALARAAPLAPLPELLIGSIAYGLRPVGRVSS